MLLPVVVDAFSMYHYVCYVLNVPEMYLFCRNMESDNKGSQAEDLVKSKLNSHDVVLNGITTLSPLLALDGSKFYLILHNKSLIFSSNDLDINK